MIGCMAGTGCPSLRETGAAASGHVQTLQRTMRLGHQELERLVPPALAQAISVPDERYEAYCASSDFIREHVFPGGHLPSLGAMLECARWTGLSMTGVTDIGPDYALTLRAWRAAWEQGKEAALTLGYSERFWRKYRCGGTLLQGTLGWASLDT